MAELSCEVKNCKYKSQCYIRVIRQGNRTRYEFPMFPPADLPRDCIIRKIYRGEI